jgi:polyhydroxyalkanoate synthesis regulator phasin
MLAVPTSRSKGTSMVIDDIRRIVEGMLGTLTPAKAQQLAKDLMEPGAAKEQVAKATADLLEWSQANKERMSTFARREISDQLKAVGGVATQAELDALTKRVRDLERAAGMTASGRSTSKRSPAKRRTTTRSATTSTKKTAAKPVATEGTTSSDT